MRRERQHVACGACTACCRGEAIVLSPEDGDDIASYETRTIINPFGNGVLTVLSQRADGSCVYLGDNGCTIHSRAPSICRTFDCVDLYLRLMQFPRAERRREPLLSTLAGPVVQAGKARAGK